MCRLRFVQPGMKRTLGTVAAVVLLLSLITWNSLRPREYESQSFLMDTLVSIRVYSTDEGAATEGLDAAFDAMLALDRSLDRYETPEHSIVAAINASSGQGTISLPDDVSSLLAFSLQVSEASGGAFDITVGPLVDLWKQSEQRGVFPDPDSMDLALSRTDYRALRLEGNDFQMEAGQSLDLGAIAKGAAADRVRDVLVGRGISAGIIDAGGNILTFGERPDRAPWRIGITDPNRVGETLGYVEVDAGAVVTAGDYQRFYTIGTQRYHHILSPRTGWPTDGLRSVTVLHASSTLADALSTACMVLGEQDALAFIDSFDNAQVMLITDDDRIIMTAGFEERFTPHASGERYRHEIH